MSQPESCPPLVLPFTSAVLPLAIRKPNRRVNEEGALAAAFPTTVPLGVVVPLGEEGEVEGDVVVVVLLLKGEGVGEEKEEGPPA